MEFAGAVLGPGCLARCVQGQRSRQCRKGVPRTSVPEPQLAEQLVEVPTTSLQRTVEQHVDIPVPGGGGGGPSSGLPGFSSGQSSKAPSKKRISERIVEQIVDPVSRGGLPGSSSSHSPAGDEERADEPGKGVFRTFPQIKKKCEGWAVTRGRNCSPSRAHPRGELMRTRMLLGELLVVFVDLGVQFLDTVVDMPVVVHVRVVDVFFVQIIDGVDVPVLMQRRICSLGHSR